ncbi:hypothetical protein [uncultured Algimonas sp.]|uniref:hypothetical protein n=1 Tax=uncultured Algimonas sp. TaxID=1547920 RepID=UPI00262006E7|nr:hypothetical protein [uncultured Algimonas sp.]
MFALAVAAVMAAPALSANPLTPAEREVCGSLSHCLKIVDDHPHDSFDYQVLTGEFARFGPRGRKALIQRIGKGGAEGGNAADLLALTYDADAIDELEDLERSQNGAVRDLARRTREALEQRLSARPVEPPRLAPVEIMTTPPDMQTCPTGMPVGTESQRREMPFFEAAIARPNADGAYRPSPVLRVPFRRSGRDALRSAVSIPGGWLAGYPDGLIRYDDATGAPSILSERTVLSVQRLQQDRPDSGVWIIFDDGGALGLALIGPSGSMEPIAWPGRTGTRLSGLQRAADGTLYLSAPGIVSLSPDGTASAGCPAEGLRR